MEIAIFGAGLVGRRSAQIAARQRLGNVTLIAQSRSLASIEGVHTYTGWPTEPASRFDVVVLATAGEHQFAMAKQLLTQGMNVIATVDHPAQIRRFQTLDALARSRSCSLGVGATYSPGISTLLALWMAADFEEIFAISTARFGTGGPACAREHHRAMSHSGTEVHQGSLRPARAGSGRALVWFPEPVGPADCYRASLADPYLLHQRFGEVPTIESRQAATRRDRITARLPMLRRPHAEGLLGAVWAEVRGMVSGRVEHRVMGATAPQATGAASMAITLAQISVEDKPCGVWSAASIQNPTAALQLVTQDVRLWTYDGSHSDPDHGDREPQQAAHKWRLGRNIGMNSTN